MKALIAFVTSILFSTSLSAQFSVGVRTGYQSSTLAFDQPGWDVSRKQSFIVPGVYFQQGLNEHVSLSLDVMLSSKGFKSTGRGAGLFLSDNYKHSILYLTFPIAVQYNFKSGIGLFAGPEIGLRLHTDFVYPSMRETDHEYFTKPLDVGIAGGASLPVTNEHAITVRYTHGLLNTASDKLSFNDENRFTNRSLQVMLSSRLSIREGEPTRDRSIGFRQGINFYRFLPAEEYDPNEDGWGSRTGYETSVDVRFGFAKYFFYSTGVMYQHRVAQFATEQKNNSFDYLMLPQMLGLHIVKTDNFRLTTEGGFAVGFPVKRNSPYLDEPERGDYSAVGPLIYGVEASVPVSESLWFFVGYRNMWDTGDFFETSYDYAGNNESYNARGESFSVGVRLHGKEKGAKPGEIKKEAENDFPAGRSFGVKGGYSMDVLSLRNQPPYASGTGGFDHGYTIGFFYNKRLGKRLSLQPELQLMHKSKDFSSLENPILLNYQPSPGIAFELGPQWSLIGKSDLTTTGSPDHLSEVIDYGFVLGIKPTLAKNLQLGVRYYYGMNDIVDRYSIFNMSKQLEGYDRNVQVCVFYRFPDRS